LDLAFRDVTHERVVLGGALNQFLEVQTREEREGFLQFDVGPDEEVKLLGFH